MLKKRKKSTRRSDPATKGDLMDMGQTLRKEFKSDLDTMGHTLRKEFKTDIDTMANTLRKEVKSDLDAMGNSLRKEFTTEMSAMEYRILEQMALLLEQHREDIIGATKDDVDSLKTRVRRLEGHAGFVAVV